MLLAALVVGLITGYYFGTRAGTIAGGVVAGLFAVAHIVPGLTVIAYVVVGAGVAGLCWYGAIQTKKDPAALLGKARVIGTSLWRRVNQKPDKRKR